MSEYHIKAKACLLTYYLPDMTLPVILDKLSSQLEGRKWTINKESCPTTGTFHYHLYVHSTTTQMDHDISYWNVDGVTPDCSPNKLTGSGYQIAVDRGHFYVECRHKIGHVTQLTNYEWGHCYIVRVGWIEALWKRKKIHTRDVIPCTDYYMCSNKRIRENVTLALQYERTQQRKAFLEQRTAALAPLRQSFNQYEELETFKSQFTDVLPRYKFLVIQGPSLMGKTSLVTHHYPDAFQHKAACDWTNYDPNIHTAIVFDDIPEWWSLIFNNKPLFQSNCESFKVHTSATNCYAKEIDAVAKPIIICTNDTSLTNLSFSQVNYLNENMIVLHIDTPTFGEPPDTSIVV